MQESRTELNLVLIADDPLSAVMLRDAMQESGINGVIRRLGPGTPAIECARQTGAYSHKPPPDLILFDYSVPAEHNTGVLREIAFGSRRARVPVVLLTSPASQDLLDNEEIDCNGAVMFSPTSLASFIRKLGIGKRQAFFRALDTLYQYRPILVRTPAAYLCHGHGEMALSA